MMSRRNSDRVELVCDQTLFSEFAMTRRIHVKFQHGVLIPVERLELSENQEVTILLDDRFPSDPVPEGGIDLLHWFARNRIQLDPDVIRDFAESPEHLDQEPDDAH
jgi:hypothetical protein